MIDFSDLHFSFWLFILAFCIVYNLTMNSDLGNVRKKVLNWQSFLNFNCFIQILYDELKFISGLVHHKVVITHELNNALFLYFKLDCTIFQFFLISFLKVITLKFVYNPWMFMPNKVFKFYVRCHVYFKLIHGGMERFTMYFFVFDCIELSLGNMLKNIDFFYIFTVRFTYTFFLTYFAPN